MIALARALHLNQYCFKFCVLKCTTNVLFFKLSNLIKSTNIKTVIANQNFNLMRT